MMATNSLASRRGGIHPSLLTAGGRLRSWSGAPAIPGHLPPWLGAPSPSPACWERAADREGGRQRQYFGSALFRSQWRDLLFIGRGMKTWSTYMGACGGRASCCQAVISLWSSYDLNSHLSSALAVYDVNRTPKWNYSLLIRSGVAFFHCVIYTARRNCTICTVSLK